jgi:hypothetical protein
MNTVSREGSSDDAFPNTDDLKAYKKRIGSLIKSILTSALMNVTILEVFVYAVAFQPVPKGLSK